MVEVRVGKRKLTVANFWRKKKTRQSRTDNSPAANVQNERSGQRPTQGLSTLSPDHGEKSSPAPDFDALKEKYRAAKSITGDGDEIILANGDTLAGKWKLVEAETPQASHDEQSFHKTKGFSVTSDGKTVNDRDYEREKDAQAKVMADGADYDGRALSFESPVIVTQDGIVVSGNNRTISGKLATRTAPGGVPESMPGKTGNGSKT